MGGMVRTSTVLLLALLSLTGCGLADSLERTFSADEEGPTDAASCEGVQCGACAPAITVRVTGGAGGLAPEAELSGIGGSCGAAEPPVTVCTVDVYAPGDYAFEVRAPGYRTAAVQVAVPELVRVGACCNCGYEARVVDVTLQQE